MACERMSTEIKAGQPGGRCQRRSVETANRIYCQALGCFAEKGFNSCTTGKIAARAGVAKGTFFVHFPTKEAVLLRCALSLPGQFKRAAALVCEEAYPSRNALAELFCQPAFGIGRRVLLLSSLLYVLFCTEAGTPTARWILARTRCYLVKIFVHAQKIGHAKIGIRPTRFVEEFHRALVGSLLMWLLEPTPDLHQEVSRSFDLLWEQFGASSPRHGA